MMRSGKRQAGYRTGLLSTALASFLCVSNGHSQTPQTVVTGKVVNEELVRADRVGRLNSDRFDQRGAMPTRLNGMNRDNASTGYVARPSSGALMPVDISRLPADVLQCDVCRARLGLPLLGTVSSTAMHDGTSATFVPAPMLGSPGLISASVADQMAKHGLVVEEFKPPEPAANAINLEMLPRDARQQFMKDLDLPWGARVMSANVLDSNSSAVEPTVSSETLAPSETLPKKIDASVAMQASEIDSVPAPPKANLDLNLSKPDTTITNVDAVLVPPSSLADLTPNRDNQKLAVEELRNQLTEQLKLSEAANAVTTELLKVKSSELEAMRAELDALRLRLDEQVKERAQAPGPVEEPHTKDSVRKPPSNKSKPKGKKPTIDTSFRSIIDDHLNTTS